jgi:hypothetical protein
MRALAWAILPLPIPMVGIYICCSLKERVQFWQNSGVCSCMTQGHRVGAQKWGLPPRSNYEATQIV